jgi:DNA-binding CsgD family transcriptional regulator
VYRPFDVGDFVAEAQCADGLRDVEFLALRTLERTIGFDTAIYVELWPQIGSSASINKEPYIHLLERYRSHPDRYQSSLEKGRAAQRAQRGVYQDTEVYNQTELDRLPFFAEIIRPQGIRRQLVASVQLRGKPIAAIHLCRHGHNRFRASDTTQMAAMIPAVALAQAAFAHRPSTKSTDAVRKRLDGLTPGERQIAMRVAQGLGNREIAEALGISPFTVRNRLSRVFDKVGAWSRTELAVWIESAGLTDA